MKEEEKINHISSKLDDLIKTVEENKYLFIDKNREIKPIGKHGRAIQFLLFDMTLEQAKNGLDKLVESFETGTVNWKKSD